ncbi:winged helix-turn-helix transcriptional regulator [Pseudonocardia zijingensis]|jgi:DNA-binding HxlR family transcriptional regulator|uniref:Winged helix-turn-helix transcriptional regulator n=2 Tax=Pseudonocardia zijingensis TaxID=153376 RepID=A0ABP3YJQ0_9PSEU
MALLDVLGQRWTMRIMWELHGHAPLPFNALQKRCDGMSSSVLSQRLGVLQDARLAVADADGYRLTTLGTELVEHLLPLVSWSERWAAELDESSQA